MTETTVRRTGNSKEVFILGVGSMWSYEYEFTFSSGYEGRLLWLSDKSDEGELQDRRVLQAIKLEERIAQGPRLVGPIVPDGYSFVHGIN